VETFEKAYTTKEISLTLEIADSTLRKWAIALEKNGYQFIRNDQNTRLFVDADLVTLQHFKQLVQDHNMQLDNAAALVVDRFGKGPFEPRTGVVPVEKDRSSSRDFNRSEVRSDLEIISKLEELEERFKMQEDFNKKLIERLEERLNEQDRYIKERLNKRDKLLVESLREALETKKMLIAVKDEEEQQKKAASAKEKERDELLKRTLEETLETKKMIAAANEEREKEKAIAIAKEEERQKEQLKKSRKGFFKWFGKD
jgi:hypothetical protein